MIEYSERFEVIVIGAGHAGCEAALACARMEFKTPSFSLLPNKYDYSIIC